MSFLTYEYSCWLLLLIAVMALLYSSVGHGGASGYLAAMALFGLAPEFMKPAALIMNIFVAALVLWRLTRAGYFNWSLFFPVIIGSVPMAFVGGMLVVDISSYKLIVGLALMLAALHMIFRIPQQEDIKPVKTGLAILMGALLGFLSGLTGVGGGIYLSPLLLLLQWTTMRGSAAIAAGFILVNSIAGLLGYWFVVADIPAGIPLMVVCAVAGAVFGSELAVRRAVPSMLRRLLGLVLVTAGIKMILAV
jgi:hypothetical protein